MVCLLLIIMIGHPVRVFRHIESNHRQLIHDFQCRGVEFPHSSAGRARKLADLLTPNKQQILDIHRAQLIFCDVYFHTRPIHTFAYAPPIAYDSILTSTGYCLDSLLDRPPGVFRRSLSSCLALYGKGNSIALSYFVLPDYNRMWLEKPANIRSTMRIAQDA